MYISNSLLALALHSPKCVYVWTRSSAGFRPQVGDELQLRPPLLLYLTSGGCRNSSAATDLFIFPTLCLQFIFYHISACDLLFREPGPNSSAVLKGSTASPLCILASGAIVHILILASDSSDTIVSILWGVRGGWRCWSTLTKSWQANGRLSDPRVSIGVAIPPIASSQSLRLVLIINLALPSSLIMIKMCLIGIFISNSHKV